MGMNKGRIGLRTKLMCSYLALIVLATALIGYFSYLNATRIVEEQIGETYKQALRQAAINITYRLEEIENVSEQILMNPQLQAILKRERSGYGDTPTVEMLADFRVLMDIIRNLENNRNLFRIRLYVSGDSLYSNEQNNIFRMEDLDPEWKRQVSESGGRLLWRSTYEQEYLPWNRYKVVSLYRNVIDWSDLNSALAVVAIDMKEEVFNDVFEQVNFSENGALFVYNDDKRITSVTSSAGAVFDESDVMREIRQAERSADMPIVRYKGTDYFTIFQQVEYAGWEIAALVPVHEIRAKSYVIGEYTGYVGILVVLLATVPAVLLSNRLTQGLRTLVHHMQEFKKGNYGGPIRVTGNDEISGLQAQYNSMILRISELVDTVYEMGLRKQAAELAALESQIKPHFLYNTLDTMKWMAVKIKAEPIVTLVDSLSKFFRLGLNRGQELTSVAKELQHVQAFMNIQDIRYAGKLRCYFEVDSGLLSCRMTKLILQPIVENAVLHGIQQKEDASGTIRIRIFPDRDHLVFDVIDDGVGISRAQADRLLQDDRGRGYGLRNVNQRIRLYYGESYGLECHSKPAAGTVIRIRLPKAPYERDGRESLYQ
ncbi:sensor histidine kinase [Paenibacillus antri]|uniref:histidine kinase n=1 Tax=Paenibacillus antri TaxID=2582848 RepID=A0A5R9G450_9BACL|nr:sensor histidine kinase [Paenibacillus antri]TLS49096.1 sensor histidine kinase [Paenibacillus antri]